MIPCWGMGNAYGYCEHCSHYKPYGSDGKRNISVLGDGKTRTVIVSSAHNINLIKQRVNAMITCWGMLGGTARGTSVSPKWDRALHMHTLTK